MATLAIRDRTGRELLIPSLGTGPGPVVNAQEGLDYLPEQKLLCSLTPLLLRLTTREVVSQPFST